MWKNLKIDNEKAFMRCTVSANQVQCILHDLQHCWTAVLSPAEVQQQVKLLNKRIKFDADTVFETLQNAEPEEVSWMAAPVANAAGDANVGVDALERTLKLKYRVRRYLFNFKWPLRKQTTTELHSLALKETSSALQALLQIVSELRETVRRKEVEIEQYKREGAALRRVTVATKSYDFAQLDERVASTNAFAAMLQQAAEQRQPTEQPETVLTTKAETVECVKSPTKQVKLEEVKKTAPLKQSPRNMKRKALQAEKMRLSRVLNARVLNPRVLEYESSQSQSLVDSQEIATQTGLKEDTNAASVSNNAVVDEQVNAPALSNTKSSCAATKSKRKLSAEKEMEYGKTQKRLINTLTAHASLQRCDATLPTTTSFNFDNIVANRSETTQPDDAKLVDKKRRNVVLSIKLSNTRELGVYIDNILSELDEIDKQLNETA